MFLYRIELANKFCLQPAVVVLHKCCQCGAIYISIACSLLFAAAHELHRNGHWPCRHTDLFHYPDQLGNLYEKEQSTTEHSHRQTHTRGHRDAVMGMHRSIHHVLQVQASLCLLSSRGSTQGMFLSWRAEVPK